MLEASAVATNAYTPFLVTQHVLLATGTLPGVFGHHWIYIEGIGILGGIHLQPHECVSLSVTSHSKRNQRASLGPTLGSYY